MIASSVIMIRPVAFGFNTETAWSNSFQHTTTSTTTEIQNAALKESEGLVEILIKKNMDVLLFNDTVVPVKPDAVFPNNWFSTHADGTIFLYPMLSPVRRKERRTDMIERLRKSFSVKRIVDLSRFEAEEKFLEGTGSMVFDHKNKIIYANLSPRTSLVLLKAVADELKCGLITFGATGKNKKDIYHTNVLMNVSDELAVVCFDCITQNKKGVKQKLFDTGKSIVEISTEQMENFCGNMLLLQNKAKENHIVMSKRALKALSDTQIAIIEKHAAIIYSAIPTIETIGGGSVRCMMAENFLQSNN